jgi:hypothetical protein
MCGYSGALVGCCENRSLSIDSNLRERLVRPGQLAARNCFLLGSENGGTAAPVLYSAFTGASESG